MSVLASPSQAPPATETGARMGRQPSSPGARARGPRPSVQGLAPLTVGEPAGQQDLDIVYEWGIGSFPASDPPSNW